MTRETLWHLLLLKKWKTYNYQNALAQSMTPLVGVIIKTCLSFYRRQYDGQLLTNHLELELNGKLKYVSENILDAK